MQTCNGQKITFTFFPVTLGEFDPPPGDIGWKNYLSPHSFPNDFAFFFQKNFQTFLPHPLCKKGVKTLWIPFKHVSIRTDLYSLRYSLCNQPVYKRTRLKKIIYQQHLVLDSEPQSVEKFSF